MNGNRFTSFGRRSALLTVAALGAVVCVIGGTVLVAALQDTARTGSNSAESAALAASADIQLARASSTGAEITCGAFSEDLASPLFTLTGVSPGFRSSDEYYCIRNLGSQPVSLTSLADELADVDFACTGDEALYDGTSCGGDALGELSGRLFVGHTRWDCATGEHISALSVRLEGHATDPMALGTLASNETHCFSTIVQYAPNDPGADVQAAQSDRVTWRFRFTGQA